MVFPIPLRTLWGMTRPGFLAATVVACALGYRADGDKYANTAKARYERSEVIEHL